jgi:hypothetical protein
MVHNRTSVHLSHNSKAVADMRQPPRYLRVHQSEEAKKARPRVQIANWG